MTNSFRLFVVMTFLLTALPVAAEQMVSTEFGPKTYRPSRRAIKDNFAVASPSTKTFKLIIKNGNGKDISLRNCRPLRRWRKRWCRFKNYLTIKRAKLFRAKRLVVKINGQKVIKRKDLNVLTGTIEKEISLQEANEIKVKVWGRYFAKVHLRIDSQFENQPPVPDFTFAADPNNPLVVNFDASNSSDDGQIVQYSWNLGDGNTSNGPMISHTYQEAGSYNVTLTITDNGNLTNSISKTVTIENQINLPPTAAFTSSAASGQIPFMLLLDASNSSDPENRPLQYSWDLGDGTTAQGLTVMHTYQTPGTYVITLRVTDDIGQQATFAASVEATGVVLPPDPSDVAPPISQNELTDPTSLTEFIYSGPNPIQREVAEGGINKDLSSWVHGQVTDRSGNPLAGVRISVLNHPEWGHTLSRADGRFDLVVNGGGTYFIDYQFSGFLPVQRQFTVDPLTSRKIEDIIMIAVDQKVLSFASNQATSQVLVGSEETDADGSRQPTLYVPPNTQAEILLANGNRQAFANLNLRFTEYTVGPDGHKMMPGSLPPSTAYTYAFEASADEALVLGAKSVEFSQPVSYYIENFINTPQGTIIPVGIYNRETGQWEAERNGVTISYSSDDANGLPLLRLSGGIASQADLDFWGITEDERQRIAERFDPGDSFWRAQLSHFSPIDLNLSPLAQNLLSRFPTTSPPPDLNDVPEPPPICNASFIEVHKQTFGENLSIFGTPFQLVYKSDRVNGYKPNRKIRLQLPQSQGGSFVTEVRIEVAGRDIRSVFPTPNGEFEDFEWDGLDAAGRTPLGLQKAQVTISNIFLAPSSESSFSFQSQPYAYEVYNTGEDLPPAFGRPATGNRFFGSIRDGGRTTLQTGFTQWLGNVDWRFEGLGSWSLDIHHRYDPFSQTLFKGDGTIVRGNSFIIEQVAGFCSQTRSDCSTNNGDGSSANAAVLTNPQDMVFDGAGNLYIAEQAEGRIRRIDSNGVITTVAGGGSDLDGENIPALQVSISNLTAVALDINGNIVYSETDRIRRINSSGLVTTIAGTRGSTINGGSGNNGPATSALFGRVNDIAIGPDGSVFVADQLTIRKIMTNGIIIRYAGNPDFNANFFQDGFPAIDGSLSNVTSLAINNQGELFFADKGLYIVGKVEPDGTGRILSGDINGALEAGDGALAVNALVGNIMEIALAEDGSIYLFNESNGLADLNFEGFHIRKISPDGIINNFVSQKGLDNTNGNNRGQPFNGIPALDHTISYVKGLAVHPNGELYILQGLSPFNLNQVPLVKVTSTFGLVDTSTGYEIVSQDGNEIYNFDMAGRHISTKRALTGAAKYSFNYQDSKLASVVDGDNNTTQIQRNAQGQVEKIIAPFGQETLLQMDGDNYLSTLSTPNSDVYRFTYGEGGLITQIEKPGNASTALTYDADGKLLRDTDAEGGEFILAQLIPEMGFEIAKQVTTAEGRMTLHQIDNNPIQQVRTLTRPDGSQDVIRSNYQSTQTESFNRTRTQTTLFQLDPQFPQRRILRSQRDTNSISRITRFEKEFNLVDANNPQSDYIITESSFLGPDEHQTTRTYTSSNNQWLTTSPEGRQTRMTIDDQEKVTRLEVGGIAPIDYSYDSQGRLSQVVQGSRTTSYAYNAEGFLASITNANNETTSFEYDLDGRVTKQILADNREIDFSYDGRGNLTGVTPPGRPQHRLQYNSQDLLAAYIPPQVGSRSTNTVYSYNRDKDLTGISRPDGKNISFNYNPTTGQLLSQVSNDGTRSFTYQPNGFLSTTTSEDGVVASLSYTSDLLQSTFWSGSISTSETTLYDQNARIIRYSNTSNLYSPDGLFSQAGFTQPVYSPDNNLVTKAFFGGNQSTGTDFQYNNFGELTRSTFNYGSQIVDTEYTRDNLGRISSKMETVLTNPSVTTTYRYDTTGRLESYIVGGQTTAYTYDDNNNITQISGPGGTVNASYDNQDRLLTFGSKTYAYNANGDLESKTDSTNSQTTSYRYDVYANLKEVTLPDSTKIEYLVDGQNRRVGRKVNGVLQETYAYLDQLRISQVKDAQGFTRFFSYGVKSNIPDTFTDQFTRITYRIVSDHLGSVRFVINQSNSQIVQEMDYDPYGKVIKDTNPGFQPFGFAGGLYDHQTGLVRFGARDYDAETGRWTTKDPIGFDGGSANLYTYALNNPVNFIDTEGETPALAFPGLAPIVINPIVGPIVGGAIICYYACGPALDAITEVLSKNRGSDRLSGDDPNPDPVTQEKNRGVRNRQKRRNRNRIPPKSNKQKKQLLKEKRKNKCT